MSKPLVAARGVGALVSAFSVAACSGQSPVTPREIGFRVRHEPQGSGTPAGMTVPENFVWMAGS
jgi:hypothetical protein